MNNVLLIRHGAVNNPDNIYYGRSYDLLLSDVGIRQIQALATVFFNKQLIPDRIVSSPLRRTKETAELIARSLGVDNNRIIVDARLTEVSSYGFEGLPFFDLNKIYGSDWYSAVDGVESYFEPITSQAARMRAALEEHSSDARCLFLVSHGDPIASLVYSFQTDIDNARFRELSDQYGYPPKASARALRRSESGVWSVGEFIKWKHTDVEIKYDPEDRARFGGNENKLRQGGPIERE